MNLDQYFLDIETKIQAAYESGCSMTQAERLSGEFLVNMMQLSAQLKKADLDARMRKTGVKAIRAAIYLEEATKTDKKPSDVMLQALVDRNELVALEQKSYDEAEVLKEELTRVYDVCNQAHIHFRKIMDTQ